MPAVVHQFTLFQQGTLEVGIGQVTGSDKRGAEEGFVSDVIGKAGSSEIGALQVALSQLYAEAFGAGKYCHAQVAVFEAGIG